MLGPVQNPLRAGELTVGGGAPPFALIAGPCVIEGRDLLHTIAGEMVGIARQRGIPFFFKASFDKANRTSATSYRGPGLVEGLAALAEVKARHGVAITTDVHLPDQAADVAEVADLLQVPAFLCRQTDLLAACAATGRPVNVKKGQFMSPEEMAQVLNKLRHFGATAMLTERGSSFGYNRLVSDLRALPIMRGLGAPVCFDVTHSVQLPGARGGSSGGQRQFAPALARAACAVGVDALFMEVHPDPDSALSDGPNMIPLDEVPALLDSLLAIDRLIKTEQKA